jgi:hypothetical protein
VRTLGGPCLEYPANPYLDRRSGAYQDIWARLEIFPFLSLGPIRGQGKGVCVVQGPVDLDTAHRCICTCYACPPIGFDLFHSFHRLIKCFRVLRHLGQRDGTLKECHTFLLRIRPCKACSVQLRNYEQSPRHARHWLKTQSRSAPSYHTSYDRGIRQWMAVEAYIRRSTVTG